jgi:hypothetical protein
MHTEHKFRKWLGGGVLQIEKYFLFNLFCFRKASGRNFQSNINEFLRITHRIFS